MLQPSRWLLLAQVRQYGFCCGARSNDSGRTRVEVRGRLGRGILSCRVQVTNDVRPRIGDPAVSAELSLPLEQFK